MALVRIFCIALFCSSGWGGSCSYGGHAPVPPCSNFQPITMKEGQSTTIEYIDWSCQHWSASLQPVSWQAHLPPPLNILFDPKFHDVGNDKWIQFIGWDGGHLASLCHAHISGDKATFTFENFKQGHLNKSDYEDPRIAFVAWDGSDWYLSVPSVGLPDDQHKAIPVYFKLRRRH